MRKQICILSLILLGFLTQFSIADEPQVITLKDGSQIKGNLVGINNDVYTVHTPALGDVNVSASQVSSISSEAVPPPQAVNTSTPPANGDLNQKIQVAQNKLMNDPQMMQQVQAMTQDPELMKLFSDPVLAQAVMSHDVKAIENNPKAQELINNPKMRALMDQLSGKISSQ